ncbi:MAG TPA: lysophospholipid acyltransferase family protein [Rhizomicrobium sp.]|nr:lysophospholipid acyltransferase family protein [Rhizomicrobium sp.]
MVAAADTVDTFSYAAPSDPRLRRALIRAIERVTGQPYLKRIYEENRARPIAGESFFDAAIRRLELKVAVNEDALARWPKSGPLVVVANHPFGVLDGIIICHLAAKVRNDFRVLTNSVLYKAEEIRSFLLPVDFADTRAALETNLRTRAEAKLHLMHGGCLVVFPAGGVSTTPSLLHRRAIDAEWKTFTGRLIAQTRAPVAPVFFAGQNSRLFQIASHISMTLRLSLLFKEVRDRIGTEVRVRVGEVIGFEELPLAADRQALMLALRERTYALEREIY